MANVKLNMVLDNKTGIFSFNSLFFIILYSIFLLGKFRMVLKLIIRFLSDKEPLSRLFHAASVDYKHLCGQDTVLDHIGGSLRHMSIGGKFILEYSVQYNEFILSFLSAEASEKKCR